MKKLLTNLYSSKIVFFLVTSVIIIALSLIPLILHTLHSPTGRSFVLIHNNVQDFFFYQALMNEGAQGNWLTTDPYTTEPHQSSIIFSYFLWLGKISKILGLSYAVTYHLVRIILSVLLLFTIYYLLFTISLPYPRLAFFFFLFASPFMHAVNEGGKISNLPYMYWWTGMDPIRRAAYLPHHMAGSLLLVTTIIFLIKYLKQQKNLKFLLLSTLLAPLLAFIHTPSLLIILLFLPISIAVYLITQFYNNNKRLFQFPNYLIAQLLNYQIIGLLAYWIIGLFMLLFMVSQTNRGFPWSQYIEWEKKLQFPLNQELIGALGILFPLSLLGLIKAVRSKRFDYILIACWFAVPLLLIPFAPRLNISNIRLIQGMPYLPLAILATLGIKILIDFIVSSKICAVGLDFVAKLRKGKRKLTPPAGGGISKGFPEQFNLQNLSKNPFCEKLQNLILITIVIVFLIFTYPTISWSLTNQIREYWPIFGNVYFDNRLYYAFTFINQNFPAKTITLSTFYTGNYLPAFTHTISSIGHSGYTYNIEQKQIQVRRFFENKMEDTEARELLLNNKITLIFQGPEEKPIYSSYLYPKILKPVYDREEATLYVLR